MRDLREVAELFKAFSDPTRLKIIKLLAGSENPLCVNAVTRRLEVSQSAVSQHLRVLRQVGLVEGARLGYHVHYSVNRDALERFRRLVRETLGEEFVMV